MKEHFYPGQIMRMVEDIENAAENKDLHIRVASDYNNPGQSGVHRMRTSAMRLSDRDLAMIFMNRYAKSEANESARGIAAYESDELSGRYLGTGYDDHEAGARRDEIYRDIYSGLEAAAMKFIDSGALDGKIGVDINGRGFIVDEADVAIDKGFVEFDLSKAMTPMPNKDSNGRFYELCDVRGYMRHDLIRYAMDQHNFGAVSVSVPGDGDAAKRVEAICGEFAAGLGQQGTSEAMEKFGKLSAIIEDSVEAGDRDITDD